MHGVDQDPDAFLCSDPWHSAPKEGRCPRCRGTGVDPGYVEVNRTDAGYEHLATPCIECRGTGLAPREDTDE